MSDIAEAVGIGPSALYRHFRGKHELLYEVVHRSFATLKSTVEGVEPGDRRAALGNMAELVLRNRGLGVLWQRESRHLDPATRDRLREELVAVERDFVGLVSHRDLSEDAADLLAWAAMGALISVSFQRIDLPLAEYTALLTDMAESILDAPMPAAGADAHPAPDPDADDPTRDRLLAAAVRLFAERGFHSVSTDDIGAAVGIAGPSIYHHFPSKVDMLTEAMSAGGRALTVGSDGIVATAPPDALRLLMERYVDFTLTNHHVADLLITEAANLPEEEQARSLAMQRDYVEHWVRLLRETDPGLSVGHARVRVQAVLTVANDIARTRHLRTMPAIAAALLSIGERVLGLPPRIPTR